MSGWRVAVAVLGAMTVLAGCGLVDDDPAGRAASGPTTTVRKPLTTVPATVPTLSAGGPVEAPVPGDPRQSPGVGAATASASGGNTPTGTSPAPGGRATTPVPGGPGWDALPEQDKVLVRTCAQVTSFQRAATTAVVDSVDRPASAYDSLAVLAGELEGLVAVAPADLARTVRPVATAVSGALAGDRSPPQLFARMNTVIAEQDLAITAVLRGLNRVCPVQVTAGDVDRGSFLRLGAPLPPELIGALAPR